MPGSREKDKGDSCVALAACLVRKPGRIVACWTCEVEGCFGVAVREGFLKVASVTHLLSVGGVATGREIGTKWCCCFEFYF